jgi:hypothetical protein
MDHYIISGRRAPNRHGTCRADRHRHMQLPEFCSFKLLAEFGLPYCCAYVNARVWVELFTVTVFTVHSACSLLDTNGRRSRAFALCIPRDECRESGRAKDNLSDLLFAPSTSSLHYCPLLATMGHA